MNGDGETGLHYAAYYGHYMIVEYLVSVNVENKLNGQGLRAVYYAEGEGYTEIINMLKDYQPHKREVPADI